MSRKGSEWPTDDLGREDLLTYWTYVKSVGAVLGNSDKDKSDDLGRLR